MYELLVKLSKIQITHMRFMIFRYSIKRKYAVTLIFLLFIGASVIQRWAYDSREAETGKYIHYYLTTPMKYILRRLTRLSDMLPTVPYHGVSECINIKSLSAVERTAKLQVIHPFQDSSCMLLYVRDCEIYVCILKCI